MKKLPIGISDFRNLIEFDYLFVDTSPLIGKIFRESAKAILITRPRRFGKTLSMSMLSYFFDNTLQTLNLFKGLRITEDKEVMKEINGYPVVFISLKDLKNNNWKDALTNLKSLISDLYSTFLHSLEEFKDNKKNKRLIDEIINKAHSVSLFIFFIEAVMPRKS